MDAGSGALCAEKMEKPAVVAEGVGVDEVVGAEKMEKPPPVEILEAEEAVG